MMESNRPITDAIDEVHRELEVRRRLYGKWVEEGKMTRQEAIDRGHSLEAALRFLMSHPDCPPDYEPTPEKPQYQRVF